jgi:hypothetical protein
VSKNIPVYKDKGDKRALIANIPLQTYALPLRFSKIYSEKDP